MVARQGTPRPPPVRRSKSRRLQPPPPPLPPPPPADNTTMDPEVRLHGPFLAEPLPLDEGPVRLRCRNRRSLPRETLQGIIRRVVIPFRCHPYPSSFLHLSLILIYPAASFASFGLSFFFLFIFILFSSNAFAMDIVIICEYNSLRNCIVYFF